MLPPLPPPPSPRTRVPMWKMVCTTNVSERTAQHQSNPAKRAVVETVLLSSLPFPCLTPKTAIFLDLQFTVVFAPCGTSCWHQVCRPPTLTSHPHLPCSLCRVQHATMRHRCCCCWSEGRGTRHRRGTPTPHRHVCSALRRRCVRRCEPQQPFGLCGSRSFRWRRALCGTLRRRQARRRTAECAAASAPPHSCGVVPAPPVRHPPSSGALFPPATAQRPSKSASRAGTRPTSSRTRAVPASSQASRRASSQPALRCWAQATCRRAGCFLWPRHPTFQTPVSS